MSRVRAIGYGLPRTYTTGIEGTEKYRIRRLVLGHTYIMRLMMPYHKNQLSHDLHQLPTGALRLIPQFIQEHQNLLAMVALDFNVIAFDRAAGAQLGFQVFD